MRTQLHLMAHGISTIMTSCFSEPARFSMLSFTQSFTILLCLILSFLCSIQITTPSFTHKIAGMEFYPCSCLFLLMFSHNGPRGTLMA